MLKQYRRLRQEVLSNRNIGSYISYAFGEIVLVVIGILIALQINNWNTSEKALLKGKDLLADISAELGQSIEQVDIYLARLEDYRARVERVLATEELEVLHIDSIKLLVGHPSYDIKISPVAYEKVKNLGLTELTENHVLNDDIRMYYTKDIQTFMRRSDVNKQDQGSRWKAQIFQEVPFYNTMEKNYPALNNSSSDEKKKALITFIQSQMGTNIVLDAHMDLILSLQIFNAYRERSAQLKANIDQEL